MRTKGTDSVRIQLYSLELEREEGACNPYLLEVKAGEAGRWEQPGKAFSPFTAEEQVISKCYS